MLPTICIFTETYYPVVGGGEIQAEALAQGLVAKGFGVMVLTRRSDPLFPETEQLGDVHVYRISPVGPGHLKKWGLLLASFLALVKLRRQYDLIFVSGFRVLGISAVLVGKLLGKATVLKADSQGEMSGEFFAAGLAILGLSSSSLPVKMFLALRNKILQSADSFVAITHDIKAELINHGISPHTIHSIPNSVDTKKFKSVSEYEKERLRLKLSLPQDNIICTFTGRLVSYKGLPLLVKVWEHILKKHQHVTLVLLGSGGIDIHNCEVELKRFVEESGLQESISFIGDVRNVYEYLQASDIFVFPSENEAFPLALIEAMACGLPVISTPVGGIQEIISDRQNGLLVEVRNFQQLYDAICTLMSDTVLSASLGKAAAQAVQERYAAETVSAQYAELFQPVSRPEGGVCAR